MSGWVEEWMRGKGLSYIALSTHSLLHCFLTDYLVAHRRSLALPYLEEDKVSQVKRVDNQASDS